MNTAIVYNIHLSDSELLKMPMSFQVEPIYQSRLRSQQDLGQVRFLGVLNADARGKHVYTVADAMLVTSFWETGPIVIWEAMAHGLPVVTIRYIGSGLERSLKDGENCLRFEIGDIDAAASPFQRFADCRFGTAIAAAGGDLVRGRYTRGIWVAAWHKCFRAVLARRAGGAPSRALRRPPSGRLDRLLGAGGAEWVGRAVSRGFHHCEPGGERPHTHSSAATPADVYWSNARQSDRVGSG